jgi:hypothetical protein
MQRFSYRLKQEGSRLVARLGWAGSGRYRVILVHVALVAVFGVFLPWMKGIDFLDSVMTAAYACLGVLFAAPAAAQAFADERPRSLNGALACVAIAVAYGEFLTLVILLAGFMTVYLSHPSFMIPPDLTTLARAGALGLAAATALASIAGWVTLRFSAGAARAALRGIFLALLVLFFYRYRWLPDVAGTAAIASAWIAAIAILGLRWEIRRKAHP